MAMVVFGGMNLLKAYPYRLYSKWVSGEGWNKYYSITGFRPLYLKPVSVTEIPPYKEDYSQLWKVFPLGNSQVPLPVRHPLFQTVPVIEETGPKKTPQVGISILAPSGRELSRLYSLPTNFSQDHTQGQELFKLPFVRNRILKLPMDQVWRDVFSHEIKNEKKSADAMIYDLYILHLRSKMIPKETLRYGLIKDGKQAMIELSSKDRDYILELVMTYDNGRIYSYVLKTEINNNESRKLRAKFLATVSFNPVDTAFSRFLYTEFKQLNFARQVDQEGMLYLFAAWSQSPDNSELFREMIFYLERGRNRELQLQPLYTFAYKHFGKTFTTRKDINESGDPSLLLQRKIELEGIEKKRMLERAKLQTQDAPDLTPEEKMNLYLKKAKEEGPKDKDDMTIH